LTFIIILSVLMGLVLGMLGGGGSILTVPLLVYIAGLEPSQAIPTSLAVLAVTSVAGVIRHARRGNVLWRLGLLFGGSAAAGSFLGGNLARYVLDSVLMGLFAVLMIVAGIAMLLPRNAAATERSGPKEISLLQLLPTGFLVGICTGLVGAGGGFLVVPTLVLFAGLSMPMAIGTSLFVISMNSTSGLLGHLQHAEINVFLAVSITIAATLGTLLGSSMVYKVQVCTLRRAFAGLVLVMATGILIQLAWPSIQPALAG